MTRRNHALISAGTFAIAVAAIVWHVTAGAGPLPKTLAAAAPATPVRASQGAQQFVIDPQASGASYRVGETFFRDNQFKVAVGVTHGIQGIVYVDSAHPDQSTIGPITINVNQLTSDSGHRDREIRSGWLESDKYPTAVFTATSIEGLPKAAAAGQTIHVRITGNLTVHNVTKPAVFTGTLRYGGDTLTGNVESTVLMTDFGFDPPSIMMLKTENKVTLDFQFTAHPSAG
ncbi:MAG TPA: YceI family protein [bacterium]|nr:YceI family protein [bacterium]